MVSEFVTVNPQLDCPGQGTILQSSLTHTNSTQNPLTFQGFLDKVL